MTAEVFDCEQGSPEWFACRLGMPTASEFEAVMAEGKDPATGKKSSSASKTRRSYMLRLVAERMTGELSETYSNGHMDRGHEWEPEACAEYELRHLDIDLEPVGFIRREFRKGMVAGCSPDRLIGSKGLVEVKSRLGHLQLDVMLKGKLPPENEQQVQGELWVSEREFCDYVSYSRRLPLFVLRVYRDEAYIKEIERKVTAFCEEMAVMEANVRRLDGSASVMGALTASLDAGGHPLPAVMP